MSDSPVASTTARALRTVHDDLAACGDLRPGPRVDATFARLVRLVLETPAGQAGAVLGHPAVAEVVPHLRRFCHSGEHQLEVAWAERIAAAADPQGELDRFPYLANYRRLGAMERDLVDRLAARPAPPPIRRVAFVGSGPLPLTSFHLAAEGARVDNLERDAEAIDVSRRVAAALGIPGLDFRQVEVGAADQLAPGATDGAAAVDLAGYDLVILAALVGRTAEEKRRAIRHLATAMAPGALLLVRSARGLRTLLYPEVDVDALTGLEVLGVVHPTDEVINSVILARKPVEDR